MARPYSIRKATHADLAEAKTWLKQEYVETGTGFWVNVTFFDRALDENRLSVLEIDGGIIGILDDMSSGANILEIHPQYRGHGFGRLLADYAEAAAIERGISVIEIECAPASSIPFWTKMGFIIHNSRLGNGGGVYAHKIIKRVANYVKATTVPYQIGFYDERSWYTDKEPFAIYEGEAFKLDQQTLALPTRAICFSPDLSNVDGSFVRIVADGLQLYANKAKYVEAKGFGVERDLGYLYFIDRIILPV